MTCFVHLFRADMSDSAMDVIRNNMAARQTDLRLYLDVMNDVTKASVVSCGFI